MSIELIASLVGIVCTGITILFIISRMKMSSFRYHSLNLEHYEKLRELCGRNANDNLSTLWVALNGVTKRNLAPTLIEWFLYTPGAYFYIKKFDKCKRYLSIDMSENNFIWNSKFKEAKSRWKERVLMFSVYTVFGTLGVLPFINLEKVLENLSIVPIILLFSVAVFCLFLATVLLYLLGIIDDAARLIKVDIRDE